MPKISFSGERPEPFDGMMMSYDAKAGKEAKDLERAKRKAEFFKKKQAEDFKLDQIEELWKLQDKSVIEEAMSKPSYIKSKDWNIGETSKKHNSKYVGRTGQHKGLPSIRKLKQADDSELGFEVPEDDQIG